MSGNPGDGAHFTDNVPRQLDVAQTPTLLGLLCLEHLDVLPSGMSWLDMLQPRPANLYLHGCYTSTFHLPESWQKLPLSGAEVWLKAVCSYWELCASILSLSRGVMSLSLILALWKEQMVPRSCTSEPELVWSQLHNFH